MDEMHTVAARARAGLGQGRRPASRARCSWSPLGAARRWWGGAARRTGCLWKVQAPSRREECLESMAGSRVFTKMDLRSESH